MKLEYNKPKGQRIRKQFDSIDVLGPNCNWYQYSTGTWVDNDSENYDKNSHHSSHHSVGTYLSNQYPQVTEKFPRTEKALIRYLKRHTELKGTRVRVSTRWVGHYLEVQL